MRKVRRLRHWKQRFNKNARFVWRKPVLWDGRQVEIGEEVPAELLPRAAKLKRFWEAQVIELAEFEMPDVLTGQKAEPKAEPKVEPKAEPIVPPTDDEVLSPMEPFDPATLVSKETDRKWHVEGLDEVFPSKTKALEAVQALLASGNSTEDGDEDDSHDDEDFLG